MKARITLYIALGASLAGWILGVGGCTTAEVSPQGTLPALPPPYVQVPHPAGYTIGDLRAIFATAGAPKLEDLKDCDSDVKKLKSMTQAQMELAEGSRELVRRDPVKYHWCFYGKILRLEDDLKAESYLDEKQKSVLDTYGPLTLIGRAFMQEYHDSRYMRWGVRHYKQISEWVFYRKVELTPQATSELVEASNPFGLLRDATGMVPVLEKYNISRQEAPPAAAPTAASIPPTAPSAVVVAPPPTPAVEATPAATPPPTVASDSKPVDPLSPPPLPPGIEAATPPLTTETVTPPTAPTTTVETSPPPATETVTTPSAERVPAAAPLPPVETPVAAPVAPPAAAAPEPAAQTEISPSDGTTEAVLQGDNVVPTESSN